MQQDRLAVRARAEEQHRTPQRVPRLTAVADYLPDVSDHVIIATEHVVEESIDPRALGLGQIPRKFDQRGILGRVWRQRPVPHVADSIPDANDVRRVRVEADRIDARRDPDPLDRLADVCSGRALVEKPLRRRPREVLAVVHIDAVRVPVDPPVRADARHHDLRQLATQPRRNEVQATARPDAEVTLSVGRIDPQSLAHE